MRSSRGDLDESAETDLRSIHDFIVADSRYYARKVVQDIVNQADDLDRMPRIGRVVPELGDKHIRELLPYSYRVIYEIKSDNIFVLAVIHKRRDLQPEMVERVS